MFKKVVLLLVLKGLSSFYVMGSSKLSPNRLSFIIYNSKQNPEVEITLNGKIDGHLKGQGPRERADKGWNATYTLKPGEIGHYTFDESKFDWYHWRWSSHSSAAYFLVKPKGAGDDVASCLKLTACVNVDWDYKIDERRLENFK